MDDSISIIDQIAKYFVNDEDEHSILILPGGGKFADSIRDIDKKYPLSEDAAHWMAILSMEQYAYYIIDNTDLKFTDSLENIGSGVYVILPYRILKKTDELEHSWNTTSDTIGAWIAEKVNAAFVKVTDVDGVLDKEGVLLENMTAKELADMGTTCIDSSMAGFLENNKMDCIVVNGRYPDRVIDAVIGKKTIATYIKGNI